MDANLILRRAASFAGRYDRNAKAEILSNVAGEFHLCGLIERAASLPRSGATRRRSEPGHVIDEAKAAFCRAHAVPHPQVWEWAQRRSREEVRDALLGAAK